MLALQSSFHKPLISSYTISKKNKSFKLKASKRDREDYDDTKFKDYMKTNNIDPKKSIELYNEYKNETKEDEDPSSLFPFVEKPNTDIEPFIKKPPDPNDPFNKVKNTIKDFALRVYYLLKLGVNIPFTFLPLVIIMIVSFVITYKVFGEDFIHLGQF